jgi:hypothetical protein
MRSTLPLKFLWILTTFLFIISIFIMGGIIINYVYNLTDKKSDGFYGYQKVQGKQFMDRVAIPSQRNAYRYTPITNNYDVEVKASSAQGIYLVSGKLLFLLLGVVGLYQLTKIFKSSTIDDPFRMDLLHRLKILAWLFISADVLRILDYFFFNSLMQNAFPTMHFQQLTEIGNGFINALILWVIILVLQRGREIKEEHALTV